MRGRCLLALCIQLSVLVPISGASADASNHQFGFDLAAAHFTTEPQAGAHRPGFGVALSYAYFPIAYLGIEAHFTSFFFGTRDEETNPERKTYHAVGIGPEVHLLPHHRFIDVWASFRLAMVSNGEFHRLGTSGGLGMDVRVAPWARLGPFVRVNHVLRAGTHPLGPGSVLFMQYGLRFSFMRTQTEAQEASASASGESP